MNDSTVPLCLSLDGTLSAVRIADERLLLAARRSPGAFWKTLLWSSRGSQLSPPPVAAELKVDPATLPLRRGLLEWLQQQRSAGRRLLLLVDGDAGFADQLAVRLPLFDEIATAAARGGTVAERIRDTLVARFGERGFDYLGSDRSDKVVWSAARRAIRVGDPGIAAGADRELEVAPVQPSPAPGLRTWIKAIRLHQWAKNTLIFIPALLAHAISAPHVLLQGALAFLSFGLCASTVYVINDLLDLPADRQHPRKRKRPFAAGVLSARSGLGLSVLMLLASAIIAVSVGAEFAAVVGGYFALTWAYSLYLKRVPLLDVMMLAGLYTLRIIAGAAAMHIPLSFWLLAFSVFMFLSLGFVKRYAELQDAVQAGGLIEHTRGYRQSDLPLILSLGTAAGYCAIVVMALYINSSDSQSLYHHHKPLWLICPLMLFWISRIWIVTSRGAMHDDPVLFALCDRVSLAVLAALAVIMSISV